MQILGSNPIAAGLFFAGGAAVMSTGVAIGSHYAQDTKTTPAMRTAMGLGAIALSVGVGSGALDGVISLGTAATRASGFAKLTGIAAGVAFAGYIALGKTS